MSITTILKNNKGLEKIVKQNNYIKKQLASRLYSTIPELLDNVIKLTKTFPSANLTNEYPIQNNGKKGFTEGYVILDDGIYRCVSDPNANDTDPKDSSEKKVSIKEFLDWIKQDDVRALDVSNHIEEYIEEVVPIYKKITKMDDEQYIEAMMRYA